MSSSKRDGGGAPPILASWLLKRALPSDPRGRSIVGDLLEEWHEREPGASRSAWYWGETLRITARYLFVRRRLPGVPAARSAGGGSLAGVDELRHGLRRALRAPTASAFTVLALAIGIAAPTVMYSLLVGVTRELPVPEPDRLVHIGRRYTPTIVRGADMASMRPLLEAPPSASGAGLESVGAFRLDRFDLSGDEGFPERRVGARVTPAVFGTLGVPPALGRVFGERDATSGEPVVLLSEALWAERFGRDRGVLGRRLRVDGEPRTVIGVMPAGFAFPDDAWLWLPLDLGSAGGVGSVELVGRLAVSGTLQALRERVAALGSESAAGEAPRIDATPWHDRSIGPDSRLILRVMLALVCFVLVIAVADVVHLLLARALGERPQTAVRLALGAGRWRVARRYLADAVVLAGAGGLLGVALAALGVRGLSAAMAPRLAWWMEIRLDPAVLLFAIGLMMAAALATGILPAVSAARLELAGAMRGGGRGTSPGKATVRATGLLLVGEVTLTCVLLVMAGLLTRGALRSMDTHGEFATAEVLAASYELRQAGYPGPAEVASFHRELAARAATHPGVMATGITTHLPGVFAPSRAVEVEGVSYPRPEDLPRPHVVHVSPGFLDALDVAPIRGRDLRWADGSGEPLAALVNEPFVLAHFGDTDPLGARVRLAAERGGPEAEWAVVVGVVPPLGLRTGRDPEDTGIYLPLAASTQRSASLLVRAAPGGPAAASVPEMRRVAAELDPDVALHDVATLAEHLRSNRDMESLFATLFTLFGASGLLLAAVGLYGLMIFTLGRRVRELAIRSALGARPLGIAWTAVRGGALQVVAGLLPGLALAAAVAPLLGTLFMGYDPRDPMAYGAAAATLLLAGVAAALGPIARALSVPVAQALRED